MRDRFSPQNFRQCTLRHLLTRTTAGSRGGRKTENSVAEGCRVVVGLWGWKAEDWERYLPQQGISGNFGKRVRLYAGSPWSRRTRTWWRHCASTKSYLPLIHERQAAIATAAAAAAFPGYTQRPCRARARTLVSINFPDVVGPSSCSLSLLSYLVSSPSIHVPTFACNPFSCGAFAKEKVIGRWKELT